MPRPPGGTAFAFPSALLGYVRQQEQGIDNLSDHGAFCMAEDAVAGKKEDEIDEEEMRERVTRLVFGGDRRRFEEFCQVLRAALPENTAAVLRGSAVTGERWEDGAPFDADECEVQITRQTRCMSVTASTAITSPASTRNRSATRIPTSR